MGILDQLTGRGSAAFVALDISAASVKLLQLSGRAGNYRVEAFASVPLDADTTADNPVTEPELLGEAIRQTVKRSGSKPGKAAIAVSSSSVITKTINMPVDLSEEEIEQQIVYEADQYIPYPVDEVSLDFQMLGPAGNDPDMQQVLLVACRRETVEAYTAAVEAAGLEVGLVDVESYALQNACNLLTGQMPGGGQDVTVAVFDFGSTNTAVNIVADNETIYTRNQSFGGQQLLQDIQRHYDISASQATIKLHNNQLDGAFTQTLLPRFAAQMAQQINQSLQFFYSASSEHDHIDQIMIAGGCAILPDIDRLLEDNIHIPTVTVNPLAGMTVAPVAKHNGVEKQAPALMVAAGLALRELN